MSGKWCKSPKQMTDSPMFLINLTRKKSSQIELSYLVKWSWVLYRAQDCCLGCANKNRVLWHLKSFSGGLPETLTYGSRPEKCSECHKHHHGFVFWPLPKPKARLEIYKVFRNRLTFFNRQMLVWIGCHSSIWQIYFREWKRNHES